MRGAVLYGPRDVRFEERPDADHCRADGCDHPAVGHVHLWIRSLAVSRTQSRERPAPMGHEYCGIVEDVGRDVTSISRVSSSSVRSVASDNTCRTARRDTRRRARIASRSPARRRRCCACRWRTARWSPRRRCRPTTVPSLLALSDVLGTGWFAAEAANVKPGATVVVVGDGAVGLLGVLSAKQMGADRIIAMSRHAARQTARPRVRRDRHRHRARRRGRRAHQGADEGRRRRLRARVRRHAGVDEQAIRATRPGGSSATSAFRTASQLDGAALFFTHVHLHGGPAPVRRYLPQLIDLVLNGTSIPARSST